jgi:hypothetical protein
MKVTALDFQIVQIFKFSNYTLYHVSGKNPLVVTRIISFFNLAHQRAGKDGVPDF